MAVGASKLSPWTITHRPNPALRADTVITTGDRRAVIRHRPAASLDPIGRVPYQFDQIHHPAAVEAHRPQTTEVRRSIARPHVPRQKATKAVVNAAQIDIGTAQIHRPDKPLKALRVIQGHPYHPVLQFHRDPMWLSVINAARPCIQQILLKPVRTSVVHVDVQSPIEQLYADATAATPWTAVQHQPSRLYRPEIEF